MRNDCFRRFTLKEDSSQEYRDEYRRDYARVLHSASFRRLEQKTQLFPGNESDFFRNRMTHSLEVAQIAKTIAIKIKKENPSAIVEPDICEIAGLLHDLGHPPFGHNGEFALDKCMVHFGGFEGNAQTLRMICRTEKKEFYSLPAIVEGVDKRVGLNLTARVNASILKYDKVIPVSREKNRSLVKGYYRSEKEVVDEIKGQLGCAGIKSFKTIECAIMDLADDIAYSTYDLEDAFKVGFLTPIEMMAVSDDILLQILDKLRKDKIEKTVSACHSELYEIFAETWKAYTDNQRTIAIGDEFFDEKTLANILNTYNLSKTMASDAYYRTTFTSDLVNQFVDGVVYAHNKDNPILSSVSFNPKTKFRVNLLKHFAYVCLINSPRLKVVENRGSEIVEKLFSRLASDDGCILMPEDYQILYSQLAEDVDKKRLVCDFIAGMTDRYAIEFYGRLFSENPQSIFKPL
jgi:dGTPase